MSNSSGGAGGGTDISALMAEQGLPGMSSFGPMHQPAHVNRPDQMHAGYMKNYMVQNPYRYALGAQYPPYHNGQHMITHSQGAMSAFPQQKRMLGGQPGKISYRAPHESDDLSTAQDVEDAEQFYGYSKQRGKGNKGCPCPCLWCKYGPGLKNEVETFFGGISGFQWIILLLLALAVYRIYTLEDRMLLGANVIPVEEPL